MSKSRNLSDLIGKIEKQASTKRNSWQFSSDIIGKLCAAKVETSATSSLKRSFRSSDDILTFIPNISDLPPQQDRQKYLEAPLFEWLILDF
uniref:Uncharacterized protein n=1 Tax=Rhizophagus irregularis (strain DAOM 181602 / DAOM 197198 / MUCL 43194) TaxID=747089 RepID=U9SIH3_RHIID